MNSHGFKKSFYPLKAKLLNPLNRKFLRYLAVSGLKTFFGYSIFSVFLILGFQFSIALFIATVIGILFNYKTIGVIVFKNESNILFLRYFTVYGFTYFCNLLLLKIVSIFSVDLYMAQAIFVIPFGLLSFILQKEIVFSN